MEIEELLESVDIIDFLSQYVELTEKNGEYWGLSPFKEEKTPSFSARRETGRFYDFSSGIGGNAVTFLRFYYKISTEKAVQMLMEYSGVGDQTFKSKEKMAATISCRRYARPKVLSKQSNSIVLPDDYMDRYEKRKDKLSCWINEGISEESLERFQVRYDSFSDRIVYPIRDVEGRIVNIGGRTVDPEWKEKKLKKYCYFYPWGSMNTIYGLADNMEYIKKQREIILFEGCKSVLIADTWGIHNTAAILTSHLNPMQMKILIKLGGRIIFALDKEVKIKNDHNIQKLKRFVNVEYLYDKNNLLEEKDSPVDKGKETFEKLYESRLWFR